MGYLYPFLCLYSLVQTVVVASAHHKAAGELIDDDYLALVYNIVYILLHYTVCLYGLVYVVQKSGVLGVVEVCDVECLFSLLYTSSGDGGCLCLFVYDVVAVLGNFLLIRLCVKLCHYIGLQGLCKAVRKGVELCGLVPPAGDDKGSTCLIYEYGVHLIHDGKVEFPLYLLGLVDDHVVTQVVKAEFVVGAVGDVAVVCLTALIVVQVVEYAAYGKA